VVFWGPLSWTIIFGLILFTRPRETDRSSSFYEHSIAFPMEKRKKLFAEILFQTIAGEKTVAAEQNLCGARMRVQRLDRRADYCRRHRLRG
jgi:hypothetical protein